MRLLSITAIFCLMVVSATHGQNELQMFVTANVNYYLPINSDKQVYPILAFDSDAEPNVLVGGMGLGFAMMKNLNDNFLWSAQANVSRRAYWSEPMRLTDDDGVPFGSFPMKGVDIVLGLSGTAHYRIGDKLSAGTGVGLDVLLYSYMRLPEAFVEPATLQNGFYRPIVPTIPIELVYRSNKMLFSLGYQLAVISRSKNPLSESYKDLYSTLTFEVGYRIH